MGELGGLEDPRSLDGVSPVEDGGCESEPGSWDAEEEPHKLPQERKCGSLFLTYCKLLVLAVFFCHWTWFVFNIFGVHTCA